MLVYNLRMAVKSIARNPYLSALMVLAIALGIGASISVLTAYYLMSGDPLPQKSDQLFAVQLDNWEGNPYRQPDEPPEQLTYRDAMALLETAAATHQSAGSNVTVVLHPPEGLDLPPTEGRSRMTSRDFFSMFEVPFAHGGVWSREAEHASELVVVLSQRTNEKFFGGRNSVGEQLQVNDRLFKVVGVLDNWAPLPRFYDVQGGGTFGQTEETFFPLTVAPVMELFKGSGNTSCPSDPSDATYQSFLDSECIWIQYWVQLDDAAAVQDYQTHLDNYVNSQKELGRFPRPVNNHVHSLMEWMEHMEVVPEDARILLGVSFMFLIVCLLNAVGQLLDKFMARPAETGLRRALGASKAQMFQQYLAEVGLIGIAGGIVGLAFAKLGLVGIHKLYGNFVDRLVHLDLTMVLSAIAIAFFATLIAGLYPTWRSCQIPPAQYLKT